MNIYPEVSKRIGLLYESGNPCVLLSFFRTSTGKGVDPSFEEELITLQTTIPALAELYFVLHEAIKQNSSEFGVSITQ